MARDNRPHDYDKLMAEMEANAAELHARIGTKPWAGLEHGAELPSPDWVPDTTALAAEAERHAAIAAQYEPERCTICQPRPFELCCCAGISTPRRRT